MEKIFKLIKNLLLMKVYRTAGLTAVWRYMGKVDDKAIKKVNLPTRIIGTVLGLLDRNTVLTIKERTKNIDSFIKKFKPKTIVEIGAGLSARKTRFKNIKFYELDLKHFKKIKHEIIEYNIGKDNLNLKINNALFIVEGVSMYLQEKQVLNLLKQIKIYKGKIIIDFFNREYSTKKKLNEKIFKFLFISFIKDSFNFRIDNNKEGIYLLKKLGYKNIRFKDYKVKKTLDVLFYADL